MPIRAKLPPALIDFAIGTAGAVAGFVRISRVGSHAMPQQRVNLDYRRPYLVEAAPRPARRHGASHAVLAAIGFLALVGMTVALAMP